MDDPIDRHLVEAYRKRHKGNGDDKEDNAAGVTVSPVAQCLTQKEAEIEAAPFHVTMSNMHIAEVYSPARIIEMAKKMGLREGWALDLTTRDRDGKLSDFDCPETRNRAVRRVLSDEPTLLVGSPMCTEFCPWMNINHKKMPKEMAEQRIRRARRHFQFCAQLYFFYK